VASQRKTDPQVDRPVRNTYNSNYLIDRSISFALCHTLWLRLSIFP